MKKGVKYLAALLMTVFLLTGCATESKYGMTITESGEVELEIIKTADDEIIDAELNMSQGFTNSDNDDEELEDSELEDEEEEEEKEVTDEERWEFLEQQETNVDSSFKKEKYTTDDMKGYKFTKNIGKLSDLSTSSSSTRVDIVEYVKSLSSSSKLFVKDGEKYKSNIKFEVDSSSSSSQGADYTYIFTLTLPEKPTSNNADEVSSDGKTLTWNIEKNTDIEFEFNFKDSDKKSDDDKKDSDSNLLMYILIGGGALLLIVAVVIIIVVVTSNKKKNGQQPQNPNQNQITQ